MKTFLRRPGNKTKHLKHIMPMIPEFTGTYYEPFLGTGAVYLHLLPKKATLNDLNKDIVNIWKLVKNDPVFMIEEIDKFKKEFLPKSNEMKLKHCKDVLRVMDNNKGDFRTIMYLIMIYCSFKGVLQGQTFSLLTEIAKGNSCHIFKENYKNKILELQKILKNIKIENKDYKKVLCKCKKEDFVFLDPPYIEDKSYGFEYVVGESLDIYELLTEVEKLDRVGVKWMMTQVDTDQVREIFKDFNLKKYENKLSINGSSFGKKELIITNY